MVKWGVLCLLLLVMDPTLSGVSAATVRRTIPDPTESDPGWKVDAHRDQVHRQDADANHEDLFMQSRSDMWPLMAMSIGGASFMLMFTQWANTIFTVPCKLKTQIPGMTEILKTHDPHNDEPLKFGHRMTRFVMQVWSAGSTADSTQVRLYPWSDIMKKAQGQMVVMDHESQRDDSYNEYSHSGVKKVDTKANALIIAIDHAGTDKKCRPFSRNESSPWDMYQLYNSAHEGADQFMATLDDTIDAAQNDRGYFATHSPAVVLFVQPLDDFIWCKHGLEYMYLAPMGTCSGADAFDRADDLILEEEIREWVKGSRDAIDTDPSLKSKLEQDVSPPAGSLAIEGTPFQLKSNKQQTQRMLTVLITFGALIAIIVRTLRTDFVTGELFGMDFDPDKPDAAIFSRYKWVLGNQWPLESFDSLIMINLILPFVIVILLGVLERFLIQLLKSKAWVECIMVFGVIAFSITIPVITGIYSFKYGGQYGKSFARRSFAFAYIKQFLSLCFYFNAFISVAREWFSFKLKPILTGEGETLLFAFIGIVDATFGFIADARSSHANGGQCMLKDLYEGHTGSGPGVQSTLESLNISALNDPRYSFDMQCDVIGKTVSWKRDGADESMDMWEAMVTEKQYDSTDGALITYDTSHCMITCTSVSTGRSSSTMLQCRDDGIIGAVWYSPGLGRNLCPSAHAVDPHIITP